jgi:hypothetical protein
MKRRIENGSLLNIAADPLDIDAEIDWLIIYKQT